MGKKWRQKKQLPLPGKNLPKKSRPRRNRNSLPSGCWLPGVTAARSCWKGEVSLPEKLSVMDLLAGEAAVTRSYGGGFVQGIDGLEATGGGWGGGRQDWFYYVNGVFSPVGAADYILGPGDVVWWDYHHWSAGLVFPAVVGCFPEPFVNGFLGRGEGVMILCPAGYEDLARKLQESLLAAGAGQVTLGEPEEALLVERSCPTIVLGRWEELQEVGWLVELNRNHQRAGLSFHFTPYGLELVDYRGQVARRVEESAGVIGATGAGRRRSQPPLAGGGER